MKKVASVLAVALVAWAFPCSAATIAVFGHNAILTHINTNMPGFTGVLVTDADLATAGFLDAFDAFAYTRDGASFGDSLSAAAAANVASFVTGNIVLLNGDFADSLLGDTFLETLFTNAITFAAANGGGYIGEFNGAVAALTSNSNGLTALNLIAGSAGPLDFGAGQSEDDIFLTAAGMGHPVTNGLGFPVNPPNVEFGADVTGVDPALILARFNNSNDGNPAIIAFQAQPPQAAPVPEPSSLAVWSLLGLAAATCVVRRQRAARSKA